MKHFGQELTMGLRIMMTSRRRVWRRALHLKLCILLARATREITKRYSCPVPRAPKATIGLRSNAKIQQPLCATECDSDPRKDPGWPWLGLGLRQKISCPVPCAPKATIGLPSNAKIQQPLWLTQATECDSDPRKGPGWPWLGLGLRQLSVTEGPRWF